MVAVGAVSEQQHVTTDVFWSARRPTNDRWARSSTPSRSGCRRSTRPGRCATKARARGGGSCSTSSISCSGGPGTRLYYSLERLWKDCPVVPLPDEVNQPRSRTGTTPGDGRRRRSRRNIVVWHGDPVEHRAPFQGHSDIPLELGVARAARLVASLPPDVVLCSDLVGPADGSPLTGLATATYDPAWCADRRQPGKGCSTSRSSTRGPVRLPGLEARRGHRGERRSEPGSSPRGEGAGRCRRPRASARRRDLMAGVPARCSAWMLDLPVEPLGVLGGLANCSWSVLEETGWGWRLAEHNAGTLPEPVVGRRLTGCVSLRLADLSTFASADLSCASRRR